MIRPVAILASIAVLGAGCTEDRAAPAPRASPPPDAKPVCEEIPGSIPGGFMLVQARELPSRDHVAMRQEYRDADGRLLVYLLGVVGEVGEGAPVAEEVELSDGTPATMLGGPEGNWIVTWQDEPPCPQMSVVGNGFERQEFEALMRDAGVLTPSG